MGQTERELLPLGRRDIKRDLFLPPLVMACLSNKSHIVLAKVTVSWLAGLKAASLSPENHLLAALFHEDS
jgi:hypothetical protein